MKTIKELGMYVHMHWGYNHPYAARTWSIEDWSAYLHGLKTLGYTFIQIWPMIDTMPPQLTESDRTHLRKMQQVIGICHRMGLRVFVGAAANTLANHLAAKYPFESRPYFTAERRINPAAAREMQELITARKQLIKPLADADGFWIIDSDPGGYEGSTPIDFVHLFNAHRLLLDEIRPGIRLMYWMWQGWHGQSKFEASWCNSPQPWWEQALQGIGQLNPEPWGILGCWPVHFVSINRLRLAGRTIYFPYGAIEGEPSFPWTNYDPQRLQKSVLSVPLENDLLGVLGNAQSHCLQLPHTYIFSHLASGGPLETIDLPGFAEQVIPGASEILANSWTAFAGENIEELTHAAESLQTALHAKAFRTGPLSGLGFNQPERIVSDLRSQLAVKIALLKLRDAISGGDAPAALKAFVHALENWRARHGFSDWYCGGAFRELLHPVLEMLPAALDPERQVATALQNFDGGNQHHGFTRLFQAIKGIA